MFNKTFILVNRLSRYICSHQDIINGNAIIVSKFDKQRISGFTFTAFVSADAILIQIQIKGNF